VRTAAATATSDAVRIGNAFATTEKIAAAKMAKRRHASIDKPSGGGVNQIPIASRAVAMPGAARLIIRRRDWVHSAYRCRSAGACTESSGIPLRLRQAGAATGMWNHGVDG
jgi:hypothetical protein